MNRFQTPKDPAETIVVEFDFSALGATALSSPTVTASVKWARVEPRDPSPQAIVSGSPQVSNQRVLVAITGGQPWTDYALRCSVMADGKPQVIASILSVRTKPY